MKDTFLVACIQVKSAGQDVFLHWAITALVVSTAIRVRAADDVAARLAQSVEIACEIVYLSTLGPRGG